MESCLTVGVLCKEALECTGVDSGLFGVLIFGLFGAVILGTENIRPNDFDGELDFMLDFSSNISKYMIKARVYNNQECDLLQNSEK